MRQTISSAFILASALIAASCSAAPAGDSSAASTPAPTAQDGAPYQVSAHGNFNQPWALAFEPGTTRLFLTQRQGAVVFFDTASGTTGTVTGALPTVDYGGQGGLGDIAFAPDYATSKQIYLTWSEAGEGDTRGAAMGRGKLECGSDNACTLSDFSVIWRQAPKVNGRGHFSHRIAFSPDGKYLFLTSGDRQKGDPAQDLSTNLGKVLRLNLDGTPAAGNPFADRGGMAAEVWSYGHRSVLGLKFDSQGRLWELEHGPKGGDELNLIEPGKNYGWPIVSNGVNYDNSDIPDHSTRPEFQAPAISWNPVIAPGNFIFYSGKMWPEWQGEAIIPGLGPKVLVRVATNGSTAAETGRHSFDKRLRDVIEAPDGSLWIAEDGVDAKLLHLARP